MKTVIVTILCLFSLYSKAQNATLLFNGSSQYLEIPDDNSLDLNSSFTIEGWVYPTGPGSQVTEGGIIINKEGSYEIARFTDGTFRYALSPSGTGSDWSWYNTTLTAPLNRWTHFAMVKSGATVIFYVNGSTSNTNSSMPATMSANTQTVKIANRTSSSHYFNGYIDELRIWSITRTQAEIKSNIFNKNLSNAAAGLIAYYQLNEGSGTTTANSCSNTTGINAALINSPLWNNSPVQFSSNSLSFDGVDDEVTIPNHSSLNITSAITIEAWCYATKTTGIQSVVSKSSNTTNTGYIFPRTDDGWSNLIVYLHIGGGWQTLSAPYPTLNVWHHLAATYDGATIRIYINGILAASRPQTGAITTNSNTLGLGNQPGFPEQFGGRADEIRIWNVARSQAQIQSNMMKELDPTTQTGLVSYYTFNQGVVSGNNTGLSLLIDHSATNSNNGLLTNFSLSGVGSNYLVQNGSLVILPVVWNNFTGVVTNSDILLNWSTAQEQNTKDYTVLHSTNRQQWNILSSLAAAGNSNSISHYQFLHTAPPKGINYYKIEQKDIDNRTSISKIISVTIGGKERQLSIFPNPVTNGIINISLSQTNLLVIYNMLGAEVLKKTLHAGTHQLDVSKFQKGVYQLRAGIENQKIIIQ